MNDCIEINFDQEIGGYIIKLPDFVKLDMLEKAKFRLETLLLGTPSRTNFSVLFDSGLHEFESITCLKFLRELLSIQSLVDNCRIFASVAPEKYTKAEFKSDTEASFNEYSAAYAWLKSSHLSSSGDGRS